MKEHKTLTFSLYDYSCELIDKERNHYLNLEDIKNLGLSEELIQKITNLGNWYSSYLNPVYQMLPSLWQQQVCNAFNREANAVFEAVVAALPHIKILKGFTDINEDPELWEYLLHPVQFCKRKGISGYDQM
jgi:hypothetical protein